MKKSQTSSRTCKIMKKSKSHFTANKLKEMNEKFKKKNIIICFKVEYDEKIDNNISRFKKKNTQKNGKKE